MISQHIIEALHTACHGSTPIVQISAMKVLQEIEGHDGAVITFLEVLKNHKNRFSDECRLLAVICLKNNVDRCWTSRGGNQCVPIGEKETLRNEIFTLLGEGNDKISIQLAVLSARIARQDFPHEWPQLFDIIFQNFDSGDWATCTHAVSTLLQILLALQAKRLSSARTQFREVCMEIVEPFSKLWSTICDQYYALDFSATATELVGEICARTNLFCTCNRIIQILLMQCFEASHKSVLIQALMVDIATNIEKVGTAFVGLFSTCNVEFIFSSDTGHSRDIWASVSSWKEDSSVDSGLPMHGEACFGYGVDALDIDSTLAASTGLGAGMGNEEKMCRITCGLSLCRVEMSLAVITLHMQKDCDRDLMTPFVSFYLKLFYCLLCESNSTSSPLMACEPLAVAFTVFLSNTLSASTGLDKFAPLSQFFLEVVDDGDGGDGKSRLVVLLELTVNKLLRLPQSMLCEWVDDPEELFATLQEASEGDNMRYAAEGLYSSMLYFSPEEVCVPLVSIISDIDQQLALSTVVAGDPLNEAVVFWDGVYTCCGLSPYFLAQACDMSQWVRTVLGPMLTELLRPQSSPQILQFRLIWLCGCWAHNIDKQMLSELLNVTVQFLNPFLDGSFRDRMVRLQVISTVETILRSETFEIDMILPVLPELFSQGCSLLSELLDDGAKVSVISLFQDIIESIGPSCGPFMPHLLHHMYGLWTEACGESLGGADTNDVPDGDDSDGSCVLLSQLLSLFACMAKYAEGIGDGADLENFMDKLLSVAAFATSGGENILHLSPYGISLWLVVLKSTPSLNNDLADLFLQNVPRMLSMDAIGLGFKDISTFLSLLEEYALKGGSNFVANSAVSDVFIHAALFLVGNVKSSVVNQTLRLVHYLLLANSDTDIADRLGRHGVISRVVQVCLASLSRGTAGDKDDKISSIYTAIADHFSEYREPDSICAVYLSLIARLAIVHPNHLLIVCTDIAQNISHELSGELISKSLFRLIIEKFDAISGISGGLWYSRICCLYLLSLYPTEDIDILDHFSEIIYMVDGIMLEQSSHSDTLDAIARAVLKDGAARFVEEDDDNGTDINFKENTITLLKAGLVEDFAVTTSIHEVVLEKMSVLQLQMGSDHMQAVILSQINSDVLHRISSNQYGSPVV